MVAENCVPTRKEQKAAKKAEKLAKLQKKLSKKAEVGEPKSTEETVAKKKGGYDPGPVEKKWCRYWKENESFRPKESTEGNIFTMCIPPPNVTGSLHVGHAMMIAIEDSIARYKRQNGYEVLYLPGLDHAGIATQSVVMRRIGHNVKRDVFMKEAERVSREHGERICQQFDRMGCSVDYGRMVFTMEPKMNKSVRHAFVELYKRGLIYRSNRLVNWSGKLRTTLSDLEVNYKEIKGGSMLNVDGSEYRFGVMYYVKYNLVINNQESDCYVVVGTTRPETILGDIALCVNPDDKRFSNLQEILSKGKVEDPLNTNLKNQRNLKEKVENLGIEENKAINKKYNEINEELKAERKNKYKKHVFSQDSHTMEGKGTGLFVVNPITKERIPIIYSSKVELTLGTGVLKVTPSHDPIDYEIGKACGLECRTVIDEENKISAPGKYYKLKRFEARKKIVEDLRESGSLIKEEAHDQVLPLCSRSGDIVEPRLKEQWWLKCREMGERASTAVRSGEIKLYPQEAESVWFKWMDGVRDWCLSRQLWWGHRIPAYYGVGKDGNTEWIVAENEERAQKEASDRGIKDIKQDEDVLDTWFSSGLWPFATLGWPEDTPDFQRYFPTTILETGSDILFFWVARMVMLSYELCGSRPFDTILLHGIVRDSHGRKMSKSLGNIIDPISVIEGISINDMISALRSSNLDSREVSRATDAISRDYPKGIPKCGADALRFALLSYTNGARDINLDILRVQGYSRLCNKIYNAASYLERSFSFTPSIPTLSPNDFSFPHNRWILSQLNRCISDLHKHFSDFNFMAATQSIHGFFLNDFCDTYIEVTKESIDSSGNVLRYVFVSILQLFHPFMPFITEDFHYRLTGSTISTYPKILEANLDNSFGDVIRLAKICRKRSIRVVLFDSVPILRRLLRANVEVVDQLESFETCGTIKYALI